MDFSTSLFAILLLPRMSLKYVFLSYAIMRGLLKAFTISELMMRIFQFLRSSSCSADRWKSSIRGCDQWSSVICCLLVVGLSSSSLDVLWTFLICFMICPRHIHVI